MIALKAGLVNIYKELLRGVHFVAGEERDGSEESDRGSVVHNARGRIGLMYFREA